MANWKHRTAADIMTTPVTSLHQSTSLDEAARTLSDLQISGAPVVGAYGAVVGVVSLYDIVGYLARHEGPVQDPGGADYGESSSEGDESGEVFERSVGKRDRDLLADTPVSEIMSGEMISVTPATPLPEVIDLMRSKKIHRVVVCEDDKPVGVVSTLDVLAALATAAASA